jgi:hypothetical protein
MEELYKDAFGGGGWSLWLDANLYRWYPVPTYEEQKVGTDCASQFKFYQFYSWLHVSAFVKGP